MTRLKTKACGSMRKLHLKRTCRRRCAVCMLPSRNQSENMRLSLDEQDALRIEQDALVADFLESDRPPQPPLPFAAGVALGAAVMFFAMALIHYLALS